MRSQKVPSTAKITETRSLFHGGFWVLCQAFFCPQHSGDASHGWSLTKTT